MAVCRHATRDDRTRPDGRQHGAPTPPRRTRLRRPRRRRGADRRTRDRTRCHRCTVVERPGGGDGATSVDLDHGAGSVRRLDGRLRSHHCSTRATRSSTAATRGTATTSTVRPHSLPAGIDYVDVGTSGGVFGLERGYCLMIGGPDAAVERLTPIFESLAPGIGTGPRTPGRRGDPEAPEEHGWLHCGPSGAGHFVKMVHNGIEYGLMAAYAEGLNVLAKANIGAVDHAVDAETAPLDAAPVLPLRPRPGQDHRGVAPRVGDQLVAARPHRRGVPRRPRARAPTTASSATRARDAGRSTPRSMKAFRCRCCRPRSTNGSRHEADPTSPTRCCRRCAPDSAATSNARTPTR